MISGDKVDTSKRHPILLLPVIIVGILFGALERFSGSFETIVIPVALLVGPWIVFAFVVGAMVGAPREAGIATACALMGGILGYYGFMALAQGHVSRTYLLRELTIWVPSAAMAGAAFGFLGAFWRLSEGARKAIAIAVPAGFLVGESGAGIYVSLTMHVTILVVYLIEFAVGICVPAIVTRGWRNRMVYCGTMLLTGAIFAALAPMSNLGSWIPL